MRLTLQFLEVLPRGQEQRKDRIHPDGESLVFGPVSREFTALNGMPMMSWQFPFGNADAMTFEMRSSCKLREHENRIEARSLHC